MKINHLIIQDFWKNSSFLVKNTKNFRKNSSILTKKNEKLQGKYVKVKGNRDGLLDELLSANNELYELKKAYEALLKSHSMLNKSYNALYTRCGHDANLLEIRTRRLDLCLNKTEDLQRINQSLQEKTALADEQMELYQKCNKEYNDYKSFLIGVAPMVFQEEKTALAAEQMKLYQTCKNEFSAYKNLTNSFFAILTGFSTFSVFLGFWIARKFPNFLAEEKKQP